MSCRLRRCFSLRLWPIWLVLACALAAGLITVRAHTAPLMPTAADWVTTSRWQPAEVAAKRTQPTLITPQRQMRMSPFHRVLYNRPDGVAVDAVEATALLDDCGVIDLLLGADGLNAYRFRVSRSQGIPSGLVHIIDAKTVATALVPNKQAEPMDGPLQLRLAYQEGQILAMIGKQTVATLPAAQAPAGSAGFGSPVGRSATDARPYGFRLLKAQIGAHSAEGRADFLGAKDGFRYEHSAGTPLWLGFHKAVLVLFVWLGLTLLLRLCLRVRFATLARQLALGFVPVVIIALLLLLSHPAEAIWLILLTLAATVLIVLLAHRRHCRWFLAAEPGRVSRPVWLALALGLLLAIGLPTTLATTGQLPASPTPTSIPWPAGKIMQPGEPLPLGETVSDFTLQATVRLEANSTLEIPFRLRTKRSICDWYALRLTTGTDEAAGMVLEREPADGSGFVKSFGPERDRPFPIPPLEPGKDYPIQIEVKGDLATVAFDHKPWDRFNVGEINTGSVTLVQREGRSHISGITFTASGDLSFFASRTGRAVLLGLFMVLIPLLAAGTAAGLRVTTRLPFVSLLKSQLLCTLPIYFGLFTCFRADPDLASPWHLAPLFYIFLAIGAWLLLTLLLILVNRPFSPLAALLLVGLLVTAEATVRQTGLDFIWTSNWQGGYVRDRFLMTPTQLGMVEPSYLQQPLVRGINSFRSKGNETRLLCIGGSTTKGYGADEENDSYPAQLEQLLGSDKYEVINAGRDAYATLDILLYLDRDLARLDPDILVLRTGTIDPWTQPGPLRQRAQWERMQESNRLGGAIRKVRLLHGLVKLISYEASTFKLRFARKHWLGRKLLPNYRPAPQGSPQANEAEFTENIEKLVAFARDRKIPLLLVEERGLALALEDAYYAQNSIQKRLAGRLRTIAEKNDGVFFVETARPFRSHFNEDLLVDQVHATRRGNHLLAEEIRRHLPPQEPE